MKTQGTPEEMEQAKNWWKDQKKRIDEEFERRYPGSLINV